MKNRFNFRHHLRTYEQKVNTSRNTALSVTLSNKQSPKPDFSLGPLSPAPTAFQKHTLITNILFNHPTQRSSEYVEVVIWGVKQHVKSEYIMINVYQIDREDNLTELRLDFWTYSDLDQILITFKMHQADQRIYKVNYMYLECPYTINKESPASTSTASAYPDSNISVEIRPERLIGDNGGELPQLREYFTGSIPWKRFGIYFLYLYFLPNYEQNLKILGNNVNSSQLRQSSNSTSTPNSSTTPSPSTTIASSITRNTLMEMLTLVQCMYHQYIESRKEYHKVLERKLYLENQYHEQVRPEELKRDMIEQRDLLYQKYRAVLKGKYKEIQQLKAENDEMGEHEDQKRIGYVLTCYQQRILKDLQQFKDGRKQGLREKEVLFQDDLDECVGQYRTRKDRMMRDKKRLDKQLMKVLKTWYVILEAENGISVV